MNDEVIDHLTRPENLAAALELESVIQDTRNKVFETLWGNVEARLEQRLRTSGPGRWNVTRKGSTAGNDSWLGFVDRADPQAKKFSFIFGDLGGQESGRRSYVGVRRGSELRVQDRAVVDSVRNVLEKRGIDGRDDPTWIGYAFLNDVGIAITSIGDNDSVVRANEDNQGGAHPLATRIADLLWELFQACREDVEALNDNYPIPSAKNR